MQALNIKNTLNCKSTLVNLAQPKVMGIINVNTDSFYVNSRSTQISEILQKAELMMQQGATFIDIGAQSTRPGADEIGVDAELNLAIPVIESLVKAFPEIILSIDTYHAKVAEFAIQAGAAIINDVSAGDDDPEMFNTVIKLKVPYILMHKLGSPKTMQINPTYQNVVLDIINYFIPKVEFLKRAGVPDLILDPGFGFGKTVAHNFEILKNLNSFSVFELPILAGLSRKSMIQKTLGVNTESALNGTTVLNTIALQNGAKILRVHDVKEAVECIKLVEQMKD